MDRFEPGAVELAEVITPTNAASSKPVPGSDRRLVSTMTKAKSKRGKPSVAIVGPGRLGLALAVALRASGYPILAFVSRRAEHARKAARLFNESQLNESNGLVRALAADQFAQLPPTDLVLIATPDDAVAETARRLAACEWTTSGKAARRRTFLHTSGALSSEVLAPLAHAGFQTGSLHPLVSVSDSRSGAKALHGAFFCLEGDKAALKLAGKIVSDLGGTCFSIRPENKALYHAAALTAAGQLTALIDLAIEMLVSCGLSRPAAQKVLMPLVESAVTNLRASPPEKALTGTFARGDLATVKRHLEALSGERNSEALEIYKLLGLRSLKLARKKGIDPQLSKEIKELLESQG